LEEHSEPVTALAWLPDDSGFLSAGMDFKIVLWVRLPRFITCSSRLFHEKNTDGQRREIWGILPVRVAHMVITPDSMRLVAIGMRAPSPVDSRAENDSTTPGANGGSTSSPPPKDEHRFLVYDIASKRTESYVACNQSSAVSEFALGQYFLKGN
jgi:hypothetical protein